MTTITGTVRLIGDGFLVFQGEGELQEVVVNTACSCRFCPGDRVCVRFDGTMTRSLPPQISAIAIRRCR